MPMLLPGNKVVCWTTDCNTAKRFFIDLDRNVISHDIAVMDCIKQSYNILRDLLLQIGYMSVQLDI